MTQALCPAETADRQARAMKHCQTMKMLEVTELIENSDLEWSIQGIADACNLSPSHAAQCIYAGIDAQRIEPAGKQFGVEFYRKIQA